MKTMLGKFKKKLYEMSIRSIHTVKVPRYSTGDISDLFWEKQVNLALRLAEIAINLLNSNTSLFTMTNDM